MPVLLRTKEKQTRFRAGWFNRTKFLALEFEITTRAEVISQLYREISLALVGSAAGI